MNKKFYTVEELLDNGFSTLEYLFGGERNLMQSHNEMSTYGVTGLPVYENRNDDEMVVSVEVPGIKEDSIDIEFKDDVLTVVAHYGEDDLKKTGDYKFAKIYKKVDGDKISASMKDGMIHIILPDTEETKAKKIMISQE